METVNGGKFLPTERETFTSMIMKKFKKKIAPWHYKVKFQEKNFAGIVKSTAFRASFVDDSMVQAK